MPKVAAKKSSTNAPAPMRDAVPSLRADYKVKRESDGKIRVVGVPVFGENVRDFGDQTIGYDLAWLKRAVAADAQLRSEGYRAPMHFGHHEPGVDRDRAGEYELRGVAKRTYAGKPTWILFADLIFDDQARFDEFSKKYVYRSVEISPEKPDEINSLALLASEAPYFRFPVPKQFTFAYRALHGGGRAFLWRFPMSMETEATNFAAAPVVQAAAETETPAEGAPEVKAEAASPQAFSNDSFQAYMQKCDARFAAIEKALGIGGEPDGDESYEAEGGESFAAEGEDEPKGEDEKAPGVKKEQKAPPVVAAAARGENMALKARLDAVERELSQAKLMEKYSVELAPWLTTPQLKSELKKAIVEGEQVVKAFAAGLRSVRPARPRASEGAPAEVVQDAPEVAKYAAMGPQKLAEARRMAAVFHAQPKDHYARRHGLEAWLRNNVGEV